MSWTDAKLEDLVLLQRGFDITKAEQRDGQVPVISSSGVQSYHNVAMVKGPGVIVGRKGSVGSVYFRDTDYWPHDTTLWSKDLKGNDAKFVAYFLRTQNLNRFDTGNSNPTLNRNHIHGQPIKKPDLPTQQRIAAILSAYDDLIENNRRRIGLLEQAARLLYREWFVHLRFPGHETAKIVDGLPEGWERMPASEAMHINPRTTWKASESKLITMVPM
jgi:type I restriction enzyme S subunit